MLNQIVITDLAVIDSAELELQPGFTVLTGETGAGKSILVDALALALGARADSKAIRAGAKRCEVTVSVAAGDRPEIGRWLATQDLDADDDCLIRRVVTAEGRSRGYVNGHPVTMQTLQDLGEQLIDICGQQAHQRLRHRGVQREILDQFGQHAALAAEVGRVHADWQHAQEQLDHLLAADDQRESRQELLGFQLRELTALNLKPGELAQLEEEFSLLSNSSRLEADLQIALEMIYTADEGAAHTHVAKARQSLEKLSALTPKLHNTSKLLGEAEALLSEVADDVRHQLDRIEHDPEREQVIADRIAEARALARKHQIDADALAELTQKLSAELADLDASDSRIASLRADAASLAKKLRQVARKLSKAREEAAQNLETTVTANMQELGMPGGRFLVSLTSNDDEMPSAHGTESVEFQVAANPGQPAGALARAASGGELSRISLALQVAVVGIDALSTLIFDEVDAGVGGGVAELVGSRLKELSAGAQVLCVTHLAQVASQADHHLRVVKMTDGSNTRTAVKSLTDDERVEEIARMLGGVKITKRTREHAREMLNLGARQTAG